MEEILLFHDGDEELIRRNDTMSGSLKLFQFWRNVAIKTIEKSSVEQAAINPDGFNNNIHWNSGHIVANMDEKLHVYVGQDRELDERYYDAFLNGTSPNQWQNKDVPSFHEVVQNLKKQEQTIQSNFEKIRNEPLTADFRGIESGEELLQFLVVHESLHIGVIKGIQYALKK